MVKKFGDSNYTIIVFKEIHGFGKDQYSKSYSPNENIPVFDMRIGYDDKMTLHFTDIDNDQHKIEIPENKEVFVFRNLLIFDKSDVIIE